MKKIKRSRWYNDKFLFKYKLKYFFYKIIRLKIYCDGERSWFGFHWYPKDTASYQFKMNSGQQKN